jgi:hypothetical protein
MICLIPWHKRSANTSSQFCPTAVSVRNGDDIKSDFAVSGHSDTQALIFNLFGLALAMAGVIIALFQLQNMRRHTASEGLSAPHVELGTTTDRDTDSQSNIDSGTISISHTDLCVIGTDGLILQSRLWYNNIAHF